MNSSQSQNSIVRGNGRRVVATLALAIFVLHAVVPLAAQATSTRHITSIWTATTAEGSRVHVVSDSPVSDYEGYTRGGRFYVKIPLADLPSARGSLLGRGFDDVQIQRYGDGIIISFHLLPGTAVRVEQAASRLEIVFTIPAGNSAVAVARESHESARTRARRIADTAGPTPAPSSSGGAYKPSGSRSTGRRSTSASESRSAAPDNRSESGSATNRSSTSPDKVSSKTANKEAISGSVEPTGMVSPSPVASPTVTPSAITGAALPVASPAVSPASQSFASPTPTRAAVTEGNDWKSRAHYWSVWAELNWLPILIGSLAALALLVFLYFWRAPKNARTKADSVDEDAERSAAAKETIIPAPGAPATPSAGASAVEPKTQAAAAAASPSHLSNAVPSRSVRDQGEEQEREVFEL